MTNAAPDLLSTEDGFRAFYREALPVVFGYFARRSSSRDVATELTQETFLAAVKSIRRGRGPVEAPLPWVVSIARRRLVDHYRKAGKRRAAEALVVQSTPGDAPVAFHTTAMEARLMTALQRVPAPQRTALVLRYVDDLPVRQVAALLGKSERAVESLLVRARDSLVRAWEETTDG